MYLATTSWLFGLIAAGAFPAAVSAQNSSSLADGTSPIFSVVPPVLTGDTDAIAAINQGLSLYDYAIDTKNFSALSGAFAPDVVADVAPNGPITSLAAYEAFLQSDLAPYKTQHTTTTVFVYGLGPARAQSASYSQAIYFGTGNLLAQTAIFYERFNDAWTKSEVDGSWKISNRSLEIFVRPSFFSLLSLYCWGFFFLFPPPSLV